MIAAMAGAMVVMFGAIYALLFAWARVHARPRLMIAGYGAYALLFLATVVLVRTLNLGGAWQLVAAIMVIGYLLAPQAIWHLCVGTHAGHPDASANNEERLAHFGKREVTDE
jgi:hypothetical protein